MRLRLTTFPRRMCDSTSDPVLFTADDYQLLAESCYREEERRELFLKLHGVEAPADDQLDRLADLAKRVSAYLRLTGQT